MDLTRVLDEWVAQAGDSPAGEPTHGAEKAADATVSRSPAQQVVMAARHAEQAERALCERATDLLRPHAPGCEVCMARSISGRMVYVVDGAVDEGELERANRVVSGCAYRRSGFARPDTQDVRHAIAPFSAQEFAGTPVCRLVAGCLAELFPDRCPQLLSRVYCNAKLFGDVGVIHRDSDLEGELSAILYPNLDWAPELGGETLFYSNDNTLALAVAPVPGRLCIFDGLIPHTSCAPSRLMFGYRYTLAMKFRPSRGPGDVGDVEDDDEGSPR